MKAFLLCAGLGNRLRPLTEDRPKPLVRVEEIPLISFPLAVLRRAGIREVGINLHYLGEQIPELLGDGSRAGLSFEYFREETLLGTGGGILQAQSWLGPEPFLVMNGDTILDLDVGGLSGKLDSHLAALHCSSEASLQAFGGLEMDAKGLLTGIRSRETTGPNPAAVYTGACLLGAKIFPFLANGGPTPCLLRHGILPALEQGRSARCWISDRYFSDVGTPDRWTEAEGDLKAGRIPDAFAREAREIYRILTS